MQGASPRDYRPLHGPRRLGSRRAVVLIGAVAVIVLLMALGARAVFIGRPFLFAAAYAGEPGVAHAIGLLAKEVDKDMALLGVRDLSELTSAVLYKVQYPAL